MELKIVIDKTKDEQITVFAHERSALVESIERLVLAENTRFVGYGERESRPLELNEIYCFATENGKVYALTEAEKLQVKSRLYLIEENLPPMFVKINQSCIANTEKIKCFEASVSGALKVTFKNGYTDYVSRRCLKNVKRRLGL